MSYRIILDDEKSKQIHKKDIYGAIRIYNLIYKPMNIQNKMKLFHNLFIKYNSLKCKVIYKNKIYKLREFIEDNDNN